MASSVKVAVRVRPFNSREKSEGAELCIEMMGKLTKLIDKTGGADKEFYFDYSYWSHDGFKQDPQTGIMSKDSPSSIYADQQLVFDDLGQEVLDNAWEGYHCCLFAYGQTGAGKSYSMVGYGPNKGIIPIACEEIFNRIKASTAPNVEYKVGCSMLEIYNEQIQDLLQNPSNRVKGGLRVREDPKIGVFVQNLVSEGVGSFEDISNVLDKGNKHRTVAATQMNATSSRAHTVLTINFTQIFYDQNTGKPLNRKESNVNLVDLAGSERASKTGATGSRLQEGSNINKSLSTLGKVITALAKKSDGSMGKGQVIPYRESKLTRILQNALGGNSKTTMIAAISPATFNYDQTLSTLRYANQVKSIKNQAIINETPQEKLIRELKEQNQKLKKMLEGGVIVMQESNMEREEEVNREEYEQMIEELKRKKEEAEKTWQQKLQEQNKQVQKVVEVEQEQKITSPYIANLNEDPLLSGYIKYMFKEGPNRIGRKNPEDMPEMSLQGLGIGFNHCTVVFQNQTYKIIPSSDPNLKTMHNGKILTQPKQLQHNDRIKFGNHNFFIFKDPQQIDNEQFDWEYAIKQANQEQVRGILGAQDEELKRKQEEMKRKLEAQWEEQKRVMEQAQKALEKQLSEQEQADSATQKALALKQEQLKKRQKAIQEDMKKRTEQLKANERERNALLQLKKLLTYAIQQINEANERADYLGKGVVLYPELYQEGEGALRGKGLQNTKVRAKVVYSDLSQDIQIHWSLQDLETRLIDMQEICNQLSYGVNPQDIEIQKDPFAEQLDNLHSTFRPIGQVLLYMDIIYHLIDVVDDFIPIINDKGEVKGSLKLTVKPKIKGVNFQQYNTLRDLAGRELELEVGIAQAIDIDQTLCTNVFCQYTLQALGDEKFKTIKVDDTTTNPQFYYRQIHKLQLTQALTDLIQNHTLNITVYGDISNQKRLKVIHDFNATMEKSKTLAPTNTQHQRFSSIKQLPSIQQQQAPIPESNKQELKAVLEAKQKELERIRKEKEKEEAEMERLEKQIASRQQRLAAGPPPVKKKSRACLIF